MNNWRTSFTGVLPIFHVLEQCNDTSVSKCNNYKIVQCMLYQLLSLLICYYLRGSGTNQLFTQFSWDHFKYRKLCRWLMGNQIIFGSRVKNKPGNHVVQTHTSDSVSAVLILHAKKTDRAVNNLRIYTNLSTRMSNPKLTRPHENQLVIVNEYWYFFQIFSLSIQGKWFENQLVWQQIQLITNEQISVKIFTDNVILFVSKSKLEFKPKKV